MRSERRQTTRWALGLVALLICVASVRADRLVLFAGGGQGGDGVPATQAKLTEPFAIGFDTAGNAYIVELTGERLLKVDKAGILHVVAGTGKKGPGADGPAKTTTFNGPHSLAVHPTDGVFVADTWNGRIRRYDPKVGTITAVAGKSRSEKTRYAGDGGPALNAVFSGIYSISMTPGGDKIYLADLENRRIRVVDLKTGTVDLVAGNGAKGTPTDGAVAKESPLIDPRACLVDPKGNVYILERGGNALRVVDAAGKIRTLASGPKGGLNSPKHLCLDLDGNVILADTGNHTIRKYDVTTGALTRIAGTGKKGNSGTGGPPLEVSFNEPHGVFVHPDGTLYIVDSMNHRVFRYEKDR